MLTDIAQSGTAAFAPRARLLKLLGAELISDEIVAITELVKNAHDADATCVTILFSGVTGEHGEILVRDNGHGIAKLENLFEPFYTTKKPGEGVGLGFG